MRIILNGCYGRMGKAITDKCKQNGIEITSGIDSSDGQEPGFPVFRTIDECINSADVIVDFSNHMATEQLTRYAGNRHLPLLVGTTGHTETELSLLANLSAKVPVFRSSNMSLGIAILDDLCRKATALVGQEADIEIIEKHHNQKLDAPSGTAITIASSIKEVLSDNTVFVFDRSHERRKRSRQEIGISSIRAGNIIGEHEILFAWGNEVLSLKHTAIGRDVFADGALRAAEFLINQKPGLYSMKDLLMEAEK